jgi:hypothetical protein
MIHPPTGSPKGLSWKEMPLSRAFSYSGYPVKESPLQVPLAEPPLREISFSTAHFYSKKGILIKSHPTLKVSGKGGPIYGPITVPLCREIFHFQNQWFNHLFVSLKSHHLKSLSTKQGENMWSPSWSPKRKEGYPFRHYFYYPSVMQPSA